MVIPKSILYPTDFSDSSLAGVAERTVRTCPKPAPVA
jgi:hypothetical protein